MSRRAFFCACASVVFSLLRVTAGMHLRHAYVFVSSFRIGAVVGKHEIKWLVYLCLLSFLRFFSQCNLARSAIKSKNGCVVCRRKSQLTSVSDSTIRNVHNEAVLTYLHVCHKRGRTLGLTSRLLVDRHSFLRPRY